MVRVVAQHEHEHDDHHGQAGDGVAEHLVGPERGVGAAIGVADREAVAAEQGHVHGEEDGQQRRQHAGVQGEEPRQRVVAVVVAADDQPLQRRRRSTGTSAIMFVATFVAQ